MQRDSAVKRSSQGSPRVPRALVLLLLATASCGEQRGAGMASAVGSEFDAVLMRVGEALTESPHEMYSALTDAKLIPGVGLAYTTADLMLVVLDWEGEPLLLYDGSLDGPGHFEGPPGLNVFGDTLVAYELSGTVHRFINLEYVDSRRAEMSPFPDGYSKGYAQLFDQERLAWTASQRIAESPQKVFVPSDSGWDSLLDELPSIRMMPESGYIISALDQPTLSFATQGGLIAHWINGRDSMWIRSSTSFDTASLVQTEGSLLMARPTSARTVWVQERSREDDSVASKEYSVHGDLLRVVGTSNVPWDSSGDTILQLVVDPDFSDHLLMLVRTLSPRVAR